MESEKNNIDEKQKTLGVYICFYNFNQIGEFKQKFYIDKNYKRYEIYEGIDNNYIGIKKENEWQDIGTRVMVNGTIYECNCAMEDAEFMDTFRSMMYKNHLINSYQDGYVTQEEKEEIKKYALSYFNNEKGYQLIKK